VQVHELAEVVAAVGEAMVVLLLLRCRPGLGSLLLLILKEDDEAALGPLPVWRWQLLFRRPLVAPPWR
jgi:hypothetical protein